MGAMAMTYAWGVDPSHSTIAFKVSYMLLGVITGEFRHFGGTVLCSDAFEGMEIDITVDVRSMTTFHRQRDEGMLSADVFDAGAWPVIRFVSGSFRRVSSGGLFEIKGVLTIRGVGVPLEMIANLVSFNDGVAEAVFTFSGNLCRSDFGLGGASMPEHDNVADEVSFFGEVLLRSFSGG